MPDEAQTLQSNRRRVRLALVLTALFMVVEVAGGLLSGSLALLADAGHMLTDTMALLLAAVAFRVSARPADAKRSFGYHRFQILAAFVNGLTLLLIVGWIVFEALQRFMDPPAVAGGLMLAVAAAGLLVNIVVFAVLHGGDQENLNIRGAALHVLGDLLGSIAAIAAASVIILTGWMPIDPLLSVLVAVLILRSAWLLVKRSAHILLEGTPEWLDVDDMQTSLRAGVPQICGIHHVHVWGLTPQYLMLTMHIMVERDDSDPTVLVRRVKALLKDEFGIRHSTIEVETGQCADGRPVSC
ncbi:MAG TPA: cation diffusion facilitator family transporter [Woeseiaceae bacterium]|nr:cation diffusion facilitator family transporter [Woeseiaceae bacterium]